MESLENRAYGYLERDLADYRAINLERKLIREEIRERAQRRAKTIRAIIGINIILSVILIISMIVSYTDMVSISSSIVVMEQDNEDLSTQLSSLENTIKPYSSQNRIEKIAKNRLGMVYPTKENIVEIKSDGKSLSIDKKESKVGLAESGAILSYISNLYR